MTGATLLLAKALDFAARKHVHQRRKGESREPYINHLAQVSRLLAEATGGADAALIAAGLLHDAIEDTDVTLAEIEAEFGSDIAALVAEVTDDKSLAWDERKRLQVEHAATKSKRAKMLKLADLTSNLLSILESPPADWSPERKRRYLAWARQVADGCRGADATLEEGFETAWRRCADVYGA